MKTFFRKFYKVLLILVETLIQCCQKDFAVWTFILFFFNFHILNITKKFQKWYFFDFFFVGKTGFEPITGCTHFAEIFAVCSFCNERLHKTSVLPIWTTPRWRRRRDSNPRWLLHHSGFRNRRLKPLGHTSKLVDWCTSRLPPLSHHGHIYRPDYSAPFSSGKSSFTIGLFRVGF